MPKLMVTIFTLVFALCKTDSKPAYDDTDKSDTVTYINSPNDGSGNYYFMFKTSDGTFREESGDVNNGTIEVNGLYSYKVHNKTYTVSYKANKNGYKIVPMIDLDDRRKPSEEPLDPAVLCSLLGRCAEEGEAGNVIPEGSV